jgi:hypothetical protein
VAGGMHVSSATACSVTVPAFCYLLFTMYFLFMCPW